MFRVRYVYSLFFWGWLWHRKIFVLFVAVDDFLPLERLIMSDVFQKFSAELLASQGSKQVDYNFLDKGNLDL